MFLVLTLDLHFLIDFILSILSIPVKFKIVNLTEKNKGEIFSWSEVGEIHRTRRGIYQKNGRIISLLTDFGKINPCYPDTENENADKILYTGAGRRGDQKLDVHNRALLDAVETRIIIPLFCKLAVGKWEFLGFWQITDGKYIFDEQNKRMVWKFTLEKSKIEPQ